MTTLPFPVYKKYKVKLCAFLISLDPVQQMHPFSVDLAADERPERCDSGQRIFKVSPRIRDFILFRAGRVKEALYVRRCMWARDNSVVCVSTDLVAY